MKRNSTMIGLGLAASIVMLGASTAVHAQAGVETFVKDPYGAAVKDPFGDCIRALGGTPLPECLPVVAVAEPPPAPKPMVVTLSGDTHFDFDKATLKPEGKATLDRLVADMRAANNVSNIRVVGHTDSIGTDAYNQGLSERRAASVKTYLASRGVNPSIVNTRGMGESQPVASNATKEGRARNRRVEITVNASKMTQ